MSTQLFGYDLTVKKTDDVDDELLRNWFKTVAKKWVFQEEKGDKTGYPHFQCRISLKNRKRINELGKALKNAGIEAHASPTANNTKDFDYVIKSQTRIAGPWSDIDSESIIKPPADIDTMTVEALRPYQKRIYDACVAQCDRKTMTFRSVDFVFESQGNVGKSVLTRFLVWNELAMFVPVMQDAQDIMAWVMSFPPASCYIIDMPRALPKDGLNGFWAGIELLRSGFAADKRHKGKFRMQSPPLVWVFSNHEPNLEALSADRWNIWFIDHHYELVRYTPERIVKMKKIWEEKKKEKKEHVVDVWKNEPADELPVVSTKVTPPPKENKIGEMKKSLRVQNDLHAHVHYDEFDLNDLYGDMIAKA